MSNYPLAARLLWAAIPHPATKPPKPQKSWKTLEPDRELQLLTSWFDGKTTWQEGSIFTVCQPITNQGVVLKDNNGLLHKWSIEWKGHFVKVKKTKGKKK